MRKLLKGFAFSLATFAVVILPTGCASIASYDPANIEGAREDEAMELRIIRAAKAVENSYNLTAQLLENGVISKDIARAAAEELYKAEELIQVASVAGDLVEGVVAIGDAELIIDTVINILKAGSVDNG